MIKIIYKMFKSLIDLDEPNDLKGAYGYFEIIIGEHSYGDVPSLKDLELSSSLLDLCFENIAEALILLQENPEVFVGDVDYPFSCLRFQVNDRDNISVSFLVLQNKLYGGLVQTSLNVEFEKKWEEQVKKDELYTTFRQSLSSYLSEIKTLNSPDDKRIQRLQELLSEL